MAHSLLVMAYHILKDGTVYRELGHDYFDRRDTARLQRRLITRLESLGLRVTLEPLAQAASVDTRRFHFRTRVPAERHAYCAHSPEWEAPLAWREELAPV